MAQVNYEPGVNQAPQTVTVPSVLVEPGKSQAPLAVGVPANESHTGSKRHI